VVVCVDGCEPDYIAQAVATGAHALAGAHAGAGHRLVADCVVPSFTNPNNLSIVTGAPPSVHGICGNYLYDTASGTEVMMNDPKWLRAPTLLAALAEAGKTVRRGHRQGQAAPPAGPRHDVGHLLLVREGRPGHAGRERHRQRAGLVGMPVPDVYSAELSEFVFAAGVKLMQSAGPT
jgi:phosphonoacetate hydrolase